MPLRNTRKNSKKEKNMKTLSIILLTMLICGCTDTPTGNVIAIPTTTLDMPYCIDLEYNNILVDPNIPNYYRSEVRYKNGSLLTDEEARKGCKVKQDG